MAQLDQAPEADMQARRYAALGTALNEVLAQEGLTRDQLLAEARARRRSSPRGDGI